MKKYYPINDWDNLFLHIKGRTKQQIQDACTSRHIGKDKDDIVGEVIGELEVIRFVGKSNGNKGNSLYECKCSCGNIVIYSRRRLRSNNTKTCGHNKHNGINRREDFKYNVGEIISDVKNGKIKITSRFRVNDKDNHSNKCYKYQCLICGYEGVKEERDISSSQKGCPVCGHTMILVGYNDLWTTHPNIACLLENPDEGYKLSKGSTKKTNWKCNICGRIKKNISVYQVVSNNGISCPYCSDGISYPNKLMFNLLRELNIKFKNEYTPDFLKEQGYLYRYDFYFELNNKKYIIEMDGGLGHGKKDINGIQDTTGIKRDNIKDLLAKDNKIDVIRIDCDYKNINNRFLYIKKAIINSRLNNLFDLKNVNWKKIAGKSENKLFKQILDMYNEGFKTKYISQKLQINTTTVLDYLNNGNNLGLCDFTAGNKKCVYKINKTSNQIICKYNSIKEAAIDNNYSVMSISNWIHNKTKNKNEFKWMLEEDYIKQISCIA